MKRLYKAFERLICAHWYWRKTGDDKAACKMCGKVKPIAKLKKKEILCKEWGTDS